MMKPIRICILGDVCPARGYLAEFAQCDYQKIFGDLCAELQGADISVANLETPASDHGAPIKKCGAAFCCDPVNLQTIKAAGIGYLSLANNHILDYGERALNDTVAEAERIGVFTFGGGKNREAAAKPVFVSCKDRKIGLVSFAEQEFNIAGNDTAGANLFDPYTSLKDIAEAKKNCDYLTVLYHGGIEHYEYPSPLLQKKCRAMVRAGADLVLCQHSHCIGTQEQYQGATILYGQGNAIFGRRQTERWNTGMLVTVDLTDTARTVSYRVFEAGETGVSFLPEERNSARLQKMAEQSACLNDPIELKEKWDAFCETQAAEYLPELLCWNRVIGKLNRMLKGKPIEHLISRKQKMITMNLVRCDAHRDVVQTILENTQKQE